MTDREPLIAALPQDFEALRVWALEHVDALPDLDEIGGNAANIVVSLHAVLTGHAGCIDESDYTPERWRVLQLCKEGADRKDRGRSD